MTLFVVVQRSKRSGVEYLLTDEVTSEGYVEYSAARDAADAAREDAGPDFEVYVGRVVDVTVPVGEPRTLADLS